MDENSSFDAWANAYREYRAAGVELAWPSETLIRLFKGTYVNGLDRAYAGKKVIDIGFGNGNNLIFLGSLGLELHGIEVKEAICEAVAGRLARSGHTAELQVGTNRTIPYPDDHFDFLVSWNVLHYEECEADILAGLAEYRRVLKPGGRFFLSTTGPDHKILKNSTTLGGHRYLINREDDFRKGEVFFYFDTPNYIRHYFSQSFTQIQVGRTHDQLFTETLDWYVVTGLKE